MNKHRPTSFSHINLGSLLRPLQWLRVPSLCAVLLASASLTHAAEPADAGLSRMPTSLRLSLESLRLSKQERMGTLGVSYLFEVMPRFWVGPSVYGAVTGDRGGFYTGGFEAAWRQPVMGAWSLEGGLYAGGGGGSAALVGGGLMLRPHLDLMWQHGPYRAGVTLSKVVFPSGTVSSEQAGLVVSVEQDFLYGRTLQLGDSLRLSESTGVGFDRVMGMVGLYDPHRGTVDKAGAPQGKLGYAGFLMQRDLDEYLFWGIEAAGAGSGNQAGYAEFLATGGVHKRLGNSRFKVGARAALGMGGGGGVGSGGGALVKGAVFAQGYFARDHSLVLEGGVAQATDGQFKANFIGLMYAWEMDQRSMVDLPSTLVRNEWEASAQHVLDAARNGGTALDLDTIGLRLNRYLTDDIYLTGQAHTALRGRAGGYSIGLFGAGARTPVFGPGISLSGEMLVGASGGGGVASGGGAIVQPMVYLRQDLSDALGVKVGLGRVKSIKGSLDSTVLDLSLSVAFGSGTKP